MLPEKPGLEMLVLEGVDLGRDAALAELQHRVADHLFHHLDAALADDAAVLVAHDQRAEVVVLDVDLRLGHPAERVAVLEGAVLQLALPALVADRAVQRVVQQDELQRARALALTLSVVVRTTMPSATMVLQAASSFGTFSTSTRQSRQPPNGVSWWW